MTQWLQISVGAAGEFAEPISGLFARHTDGRVVVEAEGGYNPDEGEAPPPNGKVTVRGWLPVDVTSSDRRAMIEVGLKLIGKLTQLTGPDFREVSDDEWNKQTFEPVRVGRRLVIVPPGAAFTRRPRDIEIPVEPGLAFGTGHHPTTRMCLAAIEGHVRKGDIMLDVGCGSAILAIAALKLGASRAVCLDIDADAIRASRANLERSGVTQKAIVAHGSLPHDYAPAGGFDLVCANISANVVIGLSQHLVDSLRPDGLLIASGILDERSAEVERAIIAAGGKIVTRGMADDWVALEISRT